MNRCRDSSSLSCRKRVRVRTEVASNVSHPISDLPRSEAVSAAESQSEPPSFLRRAGHVVLAVLIAVFMSLGSYYLFTQNNDFPLSYHPDEWSKVDQIASRTQMRNLNHPLLLLETANLLREYRGLSIRADDRDLAIVGRSASALLASIGVFGFAMAGFACYRFVGLLIVGCSAMLCPWLLVFAHYMKEDASLIGGIGVAFLGAALTMTARTWWTQLLAVIVLGIGTAAAASGKYVGAATVAPALLCVVIARVPRWWVVPSRILLLASVALATFVAINARAFEDPWTLTLKPYVPLAFEEEFEHGTTEHTGIRLLVPNLYCLRTAARHWQWHTWSFAGVGLVTFGWMLTRKRLYVTRWGVVAMSFLLIFATVLSFDAIPFQRYALPNGVLGYVLAACAVSGVICQSKDHRRRLLFTMFALMPIVVLQTRMCMAYNAQFRDDSRERLTQWLAANAGPGTRIVADHFAALDRVGDVWRFPDRKRYSAFVSSRGFACNSGSLSDLARRGVKYVVTAEPDYQRFFVPGVVASEGNEDFVDYARNWYTTLFAKGQLVWSSKPSPPSDAYVDPELRVYDITSLKDIQTESEPRRNWLERFFR